MASKNTGELVGEKISKRKVPEELEAPPGPSETVRKKRSKKERRTIAGITVRSSSMEVDPSEDTDAGSSRSSSAVRGMGSAEISRQKTAYQLFHEAEHETISFCLDSENGITSLQADFILRQMTVMSEAFSALRGENETIKQQVVTSKRTCREIKKTIIENIQEIKEACSAYASPKLTYAEKVKVKSISVPSSAVKSPRNIMTVFPAEGVEIDSSEQTKERIMGTIKPEKEKLKIRNVRKIRNNGILIETETKEDLSMLLCNKKLVEAGLKAGLPSKKLPRVIIFDVPRELNEGSLAEAIHLQNVDIMDKTQFSRDFKLVFKTGDKKKDVVNWVAEVTPDIRKILINKSRVFVGWRSCNIQDYISLTRCYRCQSFGHVAKYCKEKVDTCGHCSEEGHNFKVCPNKNRHEVCVHCKRIKRPDDHSSRAKNCPVYVMALEQFINKIDYGV